MANGKGLLASIFKDSGESFSNGGVSADFDKVVVFGDFDGYIDTDGGYAEYPWVQVVPGNLPNTQKAIVIRDPRGTAPEALGPMFGGCFVYTSDSRFGREPVALHDRSESQELYDRLTS